MQDLKAGNILGATPQKQQIMQMVGVVSAAFVLPLVLQLLNTAYGFGPQTAEQPNALSAPQATLMESVARGVFAGDLPWTPFPGAATLRPVARPAHRFTGSPWRRGAAPLLARGLSRPVRFQHPISMIFRG